MITVDVNAEEFIEKMNEVRSRFPQMVNTMIKVALLIEQNTLPYVPLDTSDLEQSFEFQYLENGYNIFLMVGYDAEDEDNGFHYAQIQHEKNFNHPRRGEQFYLQKGITDSSMEMFEMINADYLSLLMGNSIGGATTGSIEYGTSVIKMIGRGL
jgi:hypothetical protein